MTPPADREPAGLTRQVLEREEDARLAPWALRSAEARRALSLDREGRVFDHRTEFQRDRDRILHARAFRRLRLKSPGGAIPPDEPYRDRLTHTLAVCQLSRTIARGLRLNEDLVEAIALGHEIGAPPFARQGAWVLDELLTRAGAGGFSVPDQSLRVADRLEKRYAHPGLNLTHEVREGILKQGPCPAGAPAELHPDRAPSLEAQVVAAVDRAVCAIEDLDDGLRAGEVDMESAERLPLVRELLRRIGGAAEARRPARGARGRGALHRSANTLHRGLSHMLVTGIIHASLPAVRSWARSGRIDSPAAFRRARAGLPAGMIRLTPAADRMYDGLCEFVSRRLHQGARLAAAGLRARRVVGGLFHALCEDPRVADDYVLLRFKEAAGAPYLRDVPPADLAAEVERRYRGSPVLARLVADHIAGMTDAFAIAEYERMVRA